MRSGGRGSWTERLAETSKEPPAPRGKAMPYPRVTGRPRASQVSAHLVLPYLLAVSGSHCIVTSG